MNDRAKWISRSEALKRMKCSPATLDRRVNLRLIRKRASTGRKSEYHAGDVGRQTK